MKVVFVGDSITRAAYPEAGVGWPRLIELSLSNKLVGSCAQLESVNLGVDGSRSVDWKHWLLPRLRPLRPDLVAVLLGVNDCVAARDHRRQAFEDYQDSMVSIVKQILGLPSSPHIILLTPPPIGSRCYNISNDDLEQYALYYKEIKQISPSISLVDTFGELSMNQEDYVSWDRLHPSATGHLKIYNSAITSFENRLPSYADSGDFRAR